MYAALWRILPGPAWLRVIFLLILAAAALYGLFFYVFPWLSEIFVPQDSTIQAP